MTRIVGRNGLSGQLQHRSRRTIAPVLAVLLAGLWVTPAAHGSGPRTIDSQTTIVRSERIDVDGLPKPAPQPTARERTNAVVVGGHPLQLGERAHPNGGADVPNWRSQAVAEDFGAFSLVPLATMEQLPLDATGAIVGSTLVSASRDRIHVNSTAGALPGINNWSTASFFKLPGGQYYYGAFVAASIYRGRFVAAMPSFDGPSAACARGYLNVAVSTSSDPVKPWTLFRVPITDAFTDVVRIGISDDKVIFAINEWDLDPGQPDCFGGAFEGSRIRVVDWADLLDAGTLTVRDVSPTPRTDYYSWMPASNVPSTATNASGTALRLVGERFAGEWGHLAYAYVTGSARAGTAVLGGNVDLTVARAIRPLSGPPETILAFPNGNGFEDTGVASAVGKAGRIWLGANDICRIEPAPDFHACARFIILDTTVAPPAIITDGDFYTPDDDTFHPQVGVSRNGTVYYAMARSSAITNSPIDEYLAYRAADSTLAGPDEALLWKGAGTYNHEAWAFAGSFVPDPVAHGRAWLIYPISELDAFTEASVATRVEGGLTGDPGGTVTLNAANGWAMSFWSQIHFAPDPSSPTRWVRYSSSPEVEDAGQGPRLVHGRDLPSQPGETADLAAPDLGGPSTGPTVTVWAQWRTGNGTWSTPTSYTATIDSVAPTVSPLSLAFTTGTVGSTAPVRLSWTASDADSGVYRNVLSEERTNPSKNAVLYYGPTVRSATRSLLLGARYRYLLQVLDVAGNGGQAPEVIFTPRASQNSSTGVSYSGTWYSQTSSSFLGGSTRYSTRAGAKFNLSFTGRAVAFVSTKATNRGKAEIWVDGAKVATIDLRSSTTRYRQIVWQKAWPTTGAHTVQVKVLGTSGRPRVDADAFLRL